MKPDIYNDEIRVIRVPALKIFAVALPLFVLATLVMAVMP